MHAYIYLKRNKISRYGVHIRSIHEIAARPLYSHFSMFVNLSKKINETLDERFSLAERELPSLF